MQMVSRGKEKGVLKIWNRICEIQNPYFQDTFYGFPNGGWANCQ
jgi:hypothetical protein